MGIAQQADAERQPVRIGELDASVCERIHVVADLLDIFESLGTIGCLKRDDIRERGLRPFDLRRDDRLLADKAVEEPIGARHRHSGYRKAGESGHSTGVKLHSRSCGPFGVLPDPGHGR